MVQGTKGGAKLGASLKESAEGAMAALKTTGRRKDDAGGETGVLLEHGPDNWQQWRPRPVPARSASSVKVPYNEHAVYSCADDAYAGRTELVQVDFLYLDLTVCERCQGADKRVEKAVELCRPVLAACGYELRLNSAVIDNEWLAEQYRFYSSPTVRVNGVDICPSIEENDCDCCKGLSDFDVKCRLFPFNGTYYEVPPTELLVRGILEVVLQGRVDVVVDEGPYVLPENLAGFFAGKREKAADGSSQACCCGGGAAEGSCCGDDEDEPREDTTACCCGGAVDGDGGEGAEGETACCGDAGEPADSPTCCC